MKPAHLRSALAATLVAAALALSPATARCAEAADGAAAPPEETADAAATPAPFEGGPWQLVAYRSGEALMKLEEDRAPALFHFEGGHMAGSAGCNRLIAAYSLDGERLSFDPNAASTMMACPEPLMAQEQAVSAALGAVESFRLDAKLLEFLNGKGEPLLRFVALAPSPLTGQTWGLVAFSNGKQAIVSTLQGAEITLEFHDDGTLGGSDGCNRYMSGYTLQNGKLSIGPLATTRMACRGPAGASEQAQAYAQALGTVAAYRIEGRELTLITADGTPAARFRALKPEGGG